MLSLVLLAVIAALLIQLLLFLPSYWSYVAEPWPTELDTASAEKVSSYVATTAGDILSEDAGFAVLNKREVAIEPGHLSHLSRRGMWDQKGFLEDLANKRFSLVVLGFDVSGDVVFPYNLRYTDEMREGIRENYHLVEIVGDWYVYKPNLFD